MAEKNHRLLTEQLWFTRGEPIAICRRCVYHAWIPGLQFDQEGICQYCHMHEELERAYPLGERSDLAWGLTVKEMKRVGRGRKYDCIVGVSGGCDSSYLVHRLVEEGLRPLAVHFDNTWNSPIATQNLYKVLTKLGVDLYTVVCDNKEYDDIFRAFLYSGVMPWDAPTDLAMATVMYQAALKFRVSYVVEGHSFRTEGVSPLGWSYMDGKFVASIHEKFGALPMRSFPNLTLTRFLGYSIFHRLKRIRPLYFFNYQKSDAKRLLSETYGWQWYGGHHLENRTAIFGHTFWAPYKHGCDTRILEISARIRCGLMTQEEGLKVFSRPPQIDYEVIAEVKKRLRLTDETFASIVLAENRSWADYQSYKHLFEKLRPIFRLLVAMRRVPESFYSKFCFPLVARASEEYSRATKRGSLAFEFARPLFKEKVTRVKRFHEFIAP